MMSQKTLELLFDFVSGPCYLAWTQAERVAQEAKAALVTTPVLAAGVMEATGNAGPLAVEAKAKWIRMDLELWAAHWGVPFQYTPYFPIRSLPLLRGALVAEERGESARYITTIFESIWVDGLDLNDPVVTAEVMEGAGFKWQTYRDGIQRPDIKRRLLDNMESAVSRGAFGVPTFFVGSSMFFGQDRIEFVRQALSH